MGNSVYCCQQTDDGAFEQVVKKPLNKVGCSFVFFCRKNKKT